jgi:hypothetical protein
MTEDTTGDADIILTPSRTNTSQSPFLNQTFVNERLQGNPLVWGTSARWNLLGRIYNRDVPTLNTSAMLLVIDSEHETVFYFLFNFFRKLEKEDHGHTVLLEKVNATCLSVLSVL